MAVMITLLQKRNEPLIYLFQLTGWGWIIVISGFFAHVLSDGVMYAFGVILDQLMESFDVGTTSVSFVGSLLPAVILGVGKTIKKL